MNKERMAYIAPTSELLVVRFEQNVMSGGDYGTSRYAGSELDVDDVIDL